MNRDHLPVTYPTPDREVLPTSMQLWPMLDAMQTWMQRVELSVVVEMWWEAQRLKAEREERRRKP